MYGFCYSYSYGMPATFDPGSAIPCLELAVQSLGETFKGDDGKYYQGDVIGARDGEILGGGVGNFDGVRALFLDYDFGTYLDINFTFKGGMNGTIYCRGTGSGNLSDITIDVKGGASGSFRCFYYDTNLVSQIASIINFNTIYDDGEFHEVRCRIFDNGTNTTTEVYVDDILGASKISSLPPSNRTNNTFIGARVSTTFGNYNLYSFKIYDDSGVECFKTYFNAGAGGTVYDVSDAGNHLELITGSDVGFQTFEAGAYSYLDNYGYNKLGEAYLPALESNKNIDVFGGALANKGRVKYPVELWSSCLKVDGHGLICSGCMNMAEGEDFYHTFRFSLTGTPNSYELLYKFGSELYFFISSTTSKPEVRIMLNNNSSKTLTFPTELLRNGSLIEGFIKKEGNLLTLNLNGIEVNTTLSLPTIAIINGDLYVAGTINSTTQMRGEMYYLDVGCFKSDFSESSGATIYNLYEGADLELQYGSAAGIWNLSPYAYPRNNTLGYGNAGGTYIPIERGGSCLKMNGSDNYVTIAESCGLAEDEDFNYNFAFSLGGSPKYYECLFNIQSSTYYGGSMFLYVENGGVPKFKLKRKSGSSYYDYTLTFPNALPRDGSKITGFVKKEGDDITLSFNGLAITKTYPGYSPAFEDDTITIGTSDSGMSSAFITGKLFYLDITDSFKSKFSDFDGTLIENLYEGKNDGVLEGTTTDSWEISEHAFTEQGANAGLNGSETHYKDPYVSELIEACNALSPNFRFDSTDSLLWGYDDIDGNIDDFMFSDTVTNAPTKDKVTTYTDPLTGDCLIKANEYFKTI